ncbi:voltage-gated potassium channel [Aureococcus anophagefferens]|nr:voltage-gated potassium channel [Aureococcus anophagefferens]
MGCLVRWLAVAGAHVLAVAAPEALPRPDVALCTPGGAAPGCAFAVATMASAPSLPELELFVRTLARFDGSRPLYVAVDAAAGAWLRAQTFMAAVALGLEKTTVMEAALDAGHAGVLFADADVIWLSPLPAMGPEALGVSRCLCSKHTERRYGRYNGGMVFARNASVLDVWRRASVGSRYYEQSALEDVVRAVPSFLLPREADVAALYLLKSHSHDGRDHAADLELADDNATVLWMRRPLLRTATCPGPQYARWARPAADRVRAVLGRSVIRDDLCATHAALCKDPG